MATAELKKLVDQLPDPDGRGMYTTDINKEKIEATIAEIHKGRREYVLGLIDMLAAPGSVEDVKPHYALHCLANHTLTIKDETARKELCEAMASQLGGDRPSYIQSYLCQELGWAGRRESCPALGKLLTDAQLSGPAAMALMAIRDGAAEQFRAAWPKSKDAARRNIMDGLAQLAEPASLEIFKQGINDEDREVRIAAAAGLANLGVPTAVQLLIKAADVPEGWERIQADRNCLILAENLAANGNKAEAKRIYEYLKKSRTAESDQHLQEAAKRGLAVVA